jgi:hypothetical protein
VGLLLLAAPALAARDDSNDHTYDDTAKLSTDEKVEIATKAVEEMRGVLAGTLDRLKQAQDEQDMVRINCVNDKLSAVRGLVKISEQSEISLREAATRKVADLVDHEFTKITIARSRVESLRVEVEGCVGEAAAYTGGTDVSLVIDPDIRVDDPTVIDEGVVPFVEPIEPPDRLPPVTPAG